LLLCGHTVILVIGMKAQSASQSTDGLNVIIRRAELDDAETMHQAMYRLFAQVA
jgi:hypothetical protein